MDIAHLYPPGPAEVPPDLTRPDGAYRRRVVAMTVGLFGFLLVYLGLIALAAALMYWFYHLEVPAGRRGSGYLQFGKYGGLAASAVFGLFLIKGLFKGVWVSRSTHVRLRPADHPELFAFIRRVHQDVGAPAPRRVVASPDVNAALVYNTSVLNLVFPPRKDLLIGLGLVNALTLSEFKAVLAHEFGHFSQRSVGLGSYLYVANRVMHDVVYGRDGLDDMVDQYGRDPRTAVFAWTLKGALWVVRGLLGGMYRGLNRLHLSLSREMEFNADNVAVSVTGSDALIRGLYRTGFATECLVDAAQSLDAAADRGLFTDDLFYHQALAADRLRAARNDPRLGIPPDDGQLFPPTEDGVPDEYRTHPTDHMREKNAKRVYVPGPRDDRSPWLLIPNAARLKREVTAAFYRHFLSRTEPYDPRPAAEVQAVLAADHAETTYDPKYHGWYDGRFLDPGPLSDPDGPWPPARITAWLEGWPPPDFGPRMAAYRERLAERQALQAFKAGGVDSLGKTVRVRGAERGGRDGARLLAEIETELIATEGDLVRLEREVFLGHWSIAVHLGEPRLRDLVNRFQFQLDLQGVLRKMASIESRLGTVIGSVAAKRNLQPAEFSQFRKGLQGVLDALTQLLDETKAVEVPDLANVPTGAALFSLIVDRGDVRLAPLDNNAVSGDWIGKLISRLEGVSTRIRRLHFKSVGGLLACQEKLIRDWTAGPMAGSDRPKLPGPENPGNS